MLEQVNSQPRLLSVPWDDQFPSLLAIGAPERPDREREKDRRGRGARRGRGFLFYRFQLSLQSLALFGEPSVLRFQISDPLRLRSRQAPLGLAFAQRLRELCAQSRSLDHKPCPAEADEQRGGYTQGETRALSQSGETRQPRKSRVRAFDPFPPRCLRRGASCGQILVYYLSQCPGEHHVPPPPGICKITSFEAFTIGLGEIVARRSVKQLIFGFAEPIIFGLVAEIFILERGLFRRGKFSQQIAFD